MKIGVQPLQYAGSRPSIFPGKAKEREIFREEKYRIKKAGSSCVPFSVRWLEQGLCCFFTYTTDSVVTQQLSNSEKKGRLFYVVVRVRMDPIAEVVKIDSLLSSAQGEKAADRDQTSSSKQPAMDDEYGKCMPDCCKYQELANYSMWETGLDCHDGPSEVVELMRQIIAEQRRWDTQIRRPMITEMREQWLLLTKLQKAHDKLVGGVSDDSENEEECKRSGQNEAGRLRPVQCDGALPKAKRLKTAETAANQEPDYDDYQDAEFARLERLCEKYGSSAGKDDNSDDFDFPNEILQSTADQVINVARRVNEAKRHFDRLKRRYEVAEQKQTSWLLDRLKELREKDGSTM
ncbi:uncharacterized protein LOC106649639 isoform X3 [Trichogramma pretiosum]|uniref:uncharacterized protein LOC106649639 isoform X3 n=1 Tax=Trichogramma pretiosum TaxID=7493 RepID=UPI0006C994A0|nr:uncharacterized protein LOC106649639 isoform X3 [Trichogramma pretiosum]